MIRQFVAAWEFADTSDKVFIFAECLVAGVNFAVCTRPPYNAWNVVNFIFGVIFLWLAFYLIPRRILEREVLARKIENEIRLFAEEYFRSHPQDEEDESADR